MSNKWIEIACEVPAKLADILAEYLTELSGSGVCLENLNVDAFSHTEIQHAPNVTIKTYFSAEDDIETRKREIFEFMSRLAEEAQEAQPAQPVISEVSTEDWSTSWKSNFKPIRIGKRLLIVPTWEEVVATQQDLLLRIDPGMAFGTGGHETTRLCLEMLEELMEHRFHGVKPSVLDLGTGSGILAMYAALLGSRQIIAVDIDPQAVEVAIENMKLNGLVEQINCSTTPLEALEGPFDIILANILAEELVRLAPQLTDRLAPGGSLVLSGILAEKEELVLNGFTTYGLNYSGTTRMGDWIAIRYDKGAKH